MRLTNLLLVAPCYNNQPLSYMVRTVSRLVWFVVVDWVTFTIHIDDFPLTIGRSAENHLQMANLCFGVLDHHPNAQIGIWSTKWDLNPQKPTDYKSVALPIAPLVQNAGGVLLRIKEQTRIFE